MRESFRKLRCFVSGIFFVLVSSVPLGAQSLSISEPICIAKLDLNFESKEVGLLERHRNSLTAVASETLGWEIELVVVSPFPSSGDENFRDFSKEGRMRINAVKNFLVGRGFENARIYADSGFSRFEANREFPSLVDAPFKGNVGVAFRGYLKTAGMLNRRCSVENKRNH